MKKIIVLVLLLLLIVGCNNKEGFVLNNDAHPIEKAIFSYEDKEYDAFVLNDDLYILYGTLDGKITDNYNCLYYLQDSENLSDKSKYICSIDKSNVFVMYNSNNQEVSFYKQLNENVIPNYVKAYNYPFW